MEASLIAALFALAAAVTWGTGDFTGGLNARRVGPFHALLLSFPVGLLALLIMAIATREPMAAPVDLIWGAVGGLFGTAGFLCMLQGFAVGRMSIVAPVSALLAASVPVLFSAYGQGLPGELQLLGFVLAFVAIWMLSHREHDQAKTSGFWLAVAAGVGFGLFFTTLDFISEGAVFWPLVSSRLIATLVLVGIALLTRRPLVPSKPLWGLIIASGVLDVSGNFLFLRAVQTGRLDIAAVLVSLYPAVTVLWATVVAKEHMTRLQVVGVAVAVFAIAMITV